MSFDGQRGPPQIEGMASLKVDNLTYRTTVEDLKQVFKKYGELGDIYIPRDRHTHESRGFAFVRFYEKRDAEDAMDCMDRNLLDGREIRVQMARYGRPQESYRPRYRARPSYGSRHRSRSRSRSPRRRRSRNSRSRSRSPRRRKSHSRSPRRSRSKSPVRRSSRSRSRSGSRRHHSKSPSRSPRRSRSKSRSRSPRGVYNDTTERPDYDAGDN